MKPENAVRKETGILLLGTLILCGVLCGVFALVGKFDYTVVTGSLLGGLASVANFFLMGLTVQSAVNMEPDAAKKKMQLSYTLRMFAMLLILGVGVYFGANHKYFHWLAVLASALFPRVIILFRGLVLKKQDVQKGDEGES